MLQNKVII